MNQKATADREPNYTEEMVATLTAAAPLNLEKAKALEETLGRSWRSIVAKAKSLGLEYEAAEKPAKKEAKETKAEIVAEIETACGIEEGFFSGLEKATARALIRLRENVAASS